MRKKDLKRPAKLAAKAGCIFILIHIALSGGCTYDPFYDEVPGGRLKNPVGIAVKENYLYVTNANTDQEYRSAFLSKINLESKDITNIPAEFGDDSFSFLGGIAISGEYAYVAERSSNSLLKFDLEQEEIVAKTPVGEDPFGVTVATVGEGPITMILVTNMSSDDISIIDAGSMEEIAKIPLDLWVKPIEITVSGEKAYVAQQNASKVSVIDLSPESDNYLEVTTFIDWEGYCQGIASNGNMLYVSKRLPDSLAFINTESYSVLDIIDLDSRPDGVALNDSLILVTNFDSDNVYIIDKATNDLITIVEVGDGPTEIKISGDYAYVVNYLSQNISVIDSYTLEVTTIP